MRNVHLVFVLTFVLFSITLFAQNINDKILLAAAQGQTDSLKEYLLSDSIDLNYKYFNGYSALDYAIERNHKSAFTRLIQYYSSTIENAKPDDKRSLDLMAAVLNDDIGEVKRLLALGADPNRRHNSGYYPLALAARWESIEVVRDLLKYGAAVDAININKYRTSPLMELSRNGNVQIAELLISGGANINLADINNDPSINWASYFGHYDMVEYLLKKGAWSDIVGKNSGDDALGIAKRRGFPKIVDLLKQYQK